MPMDADQRGALIASSVSTAMNGLGGLVGNIMQKRENKRQREFETEMYERQKKDNLEFWNMENQYNSPEMQMERLKKAGLNPNLMYGSPQSGGNAGSINSPSQTVSNSTKTVNPMGTMDFQQGVNQYYNLKQQDAQTDLLRQQVKTQMSVEKLNAATTTLKNLEQTRQRTDNKYLQSTLDARIRQASITVDNMLKDLQVKDSNIRTNNIQQAQLNNQISMALDNNTRLWQRHKIDLKQLLLNTYKTVADTNLSKAQLGLTSQQTKTEVFNTALKSNEYLIKEIEKEMMEQGYSPDDSGLDRLIKNVLNNSEMFSSRWKPDTDIGKTLKEILSFIQSNRPKKGKTRTTTTTHTNKKGKVSTTHTTSHED